MKSFDVPIIYRSPLISAIKQKRKEMDKMKKDFTPTLLDFGSLKIYLARHFGFCYGVENAIEIAFRTVEENPGRRIFLLSEMIHNPQVNADLQAHGIQFLQDTNGKQIIPFEEITADDIVLIPAFGTTLEIEEKLKNIGIQTEKYNTTCPFVEKVWNRSEVIAKKNYTIIIHGKPKHEETRATFSHAAENAPSVIVSDMSEAKELAKYITGEISAEQFYTTFKNQYSPGFDVTKDLKRIGVVNQTTMLASETQEITDYLNQIMLRKFGADQVKNHFANTRDTLCYATNDNQSATLELLKQKADLALVVGGYNSSNTSHLVELCEPHFATYFIKDEQELVSRNLIRHFDLHQKVVIESTNYLPPARARIILTRGASSPDATVDRVIQKILGYFENTKSIDDVLNQIQS